MLAASGVYGRAAGEEILIDLSKRIGADQYVIQRDHELLLREVLSKRIAVEKGQYSTVAEILLHNTITEWDSLAQEGISVVRTNHGHEVRKHLFVVHDVVRTRLLKGTTWEGQRIDQLLMNIPGAQSGNGVRHRVAGVRQYGVRIPWNVLERDYLRADDPGADEF